MLSPRAKEVLTSVSGKSKELAIEAEKLLRFYAATFTLNKASEDYVNLPHLTGDEKLLLRLAGFELDQRSFARQVARIQMEERIRARSGTKADVESLEGRLKEISDRNREELPSLRKEIKRLEKKSLAMEEEQTTAEQRLVDMKAARRELRDHLPPHLAEEVLHEENWAQIECGKELGEMQAEKGWLPSLIEAAISERERVKGLHSARYQGGAPVLTTDINLVSAVKEQQLRDDEMPPLLNVKGELNLDDCIDYLRDRSVVVEDRVEQCLQDMHENLSKARAIVEEFVEAGFLSDDTQATTSPPQEGGE
ncbi:hypothetical protein [Aeoliella sp.]|uniref:hypothetical protein n=1 Tax=Aeoliella sp. TaxID=2795800 RepID=UPI003CCB9657